MTTPSPNPHDSPEPLSTDSIQPHPSVATSPAAWLRFLLPVIAGVTLDLYSKAWAQANLRDRSDDLVILPNILDFRYTINRGAVFGIGQGLIPLFAIFSVIALTVILYIFINSQRRQIFLHLALGLITAGAIGNFYDRVVFGQVRDFMLLFPSTKLWPWIFNVADVMLCTGVPLLMLCWISQPPPRKSD